MDFKVRVFLGDRLIEEDKLKDIVINSPVIDRIINRAVKEACEKEEQCGDAS